MRDSTARLWPSEHRVVEAWRSDARTDIDRISYSPEFRRLAGVTQVVPPQSDHLFHDRLTHSMKVAQVAATLARKVATHTKQTGWDADNGINIADWIDPDYCYAAGLAHDIGHPPFGHAGEHTLQQLLDGSGVGDALKRSFEGNAQSTHIVASLSFRKSDDEGGLNLTLRSIAAIAKYPWLRHEHPHAIEKLDAKWSFYPEEGWILNRLRDEGFVARETTPLKGGNGQILRDKDNNPRLQVDKVYRWPEAEVMDWADDISYAVHDLEDFYRAGRIPLHRIGLGLKQIFDDNFDAMTPAEFLESDFAAVSADREVQAALLHARTKMSKARDINGKLLGDRVKAAFEKIRDVLVLRIPLGRFDGSRSAHGALQNFGSEAITYLSEATHVEIVEPDGDRRVAFRVDPVAQLVAEFFKAMCHHYVIETAVLATLQYGQARNIVEMFNALQEQAEHWAADATQPRTLPARLREYLDQVLPGGTADRAQIMGAVQVAVTDFICGLRDQQADLLVDRLLGRRSNLDVAGSWLDT
jgi:dGTPase